VPFDSLARPDPVQRLAELVEGERRGQQRARVDHPAADQLDGRGEAAQDRRFDLSKCK
jgi:hypothetical protein